MTVKAKPTRAVSNDVNSTEDMLALGLAPNMVGDFGVDTSAIKGMPAAYQAAVKSVRHVSPNYLRLSRWSASNRTSCSRATTTASSLGATR